MNKSTIDQIRTLVGKLNPSTYNMFAKQIINSNIGKIRHVEIKWTNGIRKSVHIFCDGTEKNKTIGFISDFILNTLKTECFVNSRDKMYFVKYKKDLAADQINYCIDINQNTVNNVTNILLSKIEINNKIATFTILGYDGTLSLLIESIRLI